MSKRRLASLLPTLWSECDTPTMSLRSGAKLDSRFWTHSKASKVQQCANLSNKARTERGSRRQGSSRCRWFYQQRRVRVTILYKGSGTLLSRLGRRQTLTRLRVLYATTASNPKYWSRCQCKYLWSARQTSSRRSCQSEGTTPSKFDYRPCWPSDRGNEAHLSI